MMMISKLESSTLQIILLQIVLAAMIIGTMLAFLVVSFITQEADAAQSTTINFEQYQKDNAKDVVLENPVGTENLLDRALRSLTRPNHDGYSYDSEQEKIMFEAWIPLSK
jgi:hypothetical protein